MPLFVVTWELIDLKKKTKRELSPYAGLKRHKKQKEIDIIAQTKF